MRLMKADMKEIQRLRSESKKSGYIGTATEHKPLGVIFAQISPASDSYSIATYGERVSKLYSVTAEAGSDVRDGDKLVIYGEECKVISVMRYSTHTAITVERTGIYGN